MAFDAARLHPTLVAQVGFGARWAALTEPAPGATVDVADVGVRLAMYRRLIEATNPRGALGAHDELHPLWGYVAQLAWQQRSGRLGADGDAIAPTSWWGGCNYALSVVPYWSAMQAGLVPRLSFPDPDHFYLMATDSWRRALVMMVDYVRDADLEWLRLEVWRAHLHAIDAAERANRARYYALPATERRFARGWVRMVALFGAAAWRTDLVRIAGPGGGALPSRVLREHDDLADLPPAERATARQVLAVGDRAPWRWAVELRVWQRLMRERPERDDAAAILAALFGQGDGVWSTRLRAARAALASTPPRIPPPKDAT